MFRLLARDAARTSGFIEEDRIVLISQVKNADGSITVAVRESGGEARAVKGATSVHALALEAAIGWSARND